MFAYIIYLSLFCIKINDDVPVCLYCRYVANVIVYNKVCLIVLTNSVHDQYLLSNMRVNENMHELPPPVEYSRGRVSGRG